jgi:hypothetical protein
MLLAKFHNLLSNRWNFQISPRLARSVPFHQSYERKSASKISSKNAAEISDQKHRNAPAPDPEIAMRVFDTDGRAMLSTPLR